MLLFLLLASVGAEGPLMNTASHCTCALVVTQRELLQLLSVGLQVVIFGPVRLFYLFEFSKYDYKMIAESNHEAY